MGSNYFGDGEVAKRALIKTFRKFKMMPPLSIRKALIDSLSPMPHNVGTGSTLVVEDLSMTLKSITFDWPKKDATK